MSAPPRIARLAAVAGNEARTVMGLMSGTSLDGLDLALCRLRGHGTGTQLELLHFANEPYTEDDKTRLRALAFREQVSLRELTIAHGWLAHRHAAMVLAALQAWGVAPKQVDCLASHGQTLYHAPQSWGAEVAESAPGDVPPYSAALQSATLHSATLQIGDGDRLALRTGILTLSDFRQKEIAGGGQGAPLAPYAEALLFGGAARARILLNLGGIANFTWLPAAGDERPIVSGDTGPANTLIDLAVRRQFPGQPEGFDRDGAIAAGGSVNPALLATLKAHPYFARCCPKSTGPEMFGEAYLAEAMERTAAGGGARDPADVVATLTRLTAETVAEALRREAPMLGGVEIIVSGGGSHNATLAGWLRGLLPELQWCGVESLGVPPDAKEAVLFAVLANETLCGAGFADQGGLGAGRIGFGKLSFPD